MEQNALDSIVGQTTIVARLQTSLNAPPETTFIQPLLLGQAGLGKTELAKAVAEELAKKLKVDVLWFNSPEEFRSADSAEMQRLMDWLEEESGILVIDECHKFGEKTTISMQKVRSFLLKCLDQQNQGKLIQFDAEKSFTFDKSKKVIIMMTNHDDRLDSALMSRMDVCRLAPYTSDELELIALKMLTESSMGVSDEKVLKLLAKASRGTARPLDTMIRHIKRYGTTMISIQQAIQAMIELDMFPKGLKMDEIRLLQLAKDAVPKPVVKASITGLSATLNDSVAYLMAQKFLTIVGNQLKTTKEGMTYLSALQANGFIAA